MSQSPNVILIHCHDLGRFLSGYGAGPIPSPHLEDFGDRSTVFDRAFATAPLCTPARASLFTGMSPHANGLMGLAHHGWRYRRNVQTLPEILHSHGYDTALIGLQHEHPDPTVLGFGEVHGVGFLPRAWPVAEEAASWLRRRGESTRPYFLTVGMWEVHRPWRTEDYTFADPDAVQVPEFLPDNAHTREDLAGFYGAIRQLDAAVGHVLQAIDTYCDPAGTMVIFTTDHGAAFPGAKGTLYDPGVEVALIVRPPSSWTTAPGRRAEMVSHLDIVPTLAELAGAEMRPEWEGQSLVPALQGGPSGMDRDLYFEKTFHDAYDPVRAVRTGRHKLIRNFTGGPRLQLSKDLEESSSRRGLGDDHFAPRPAVELYDLIDDPAERNDLADDPDHAAIVADLDARLSRWMTQTRDPVLEGAIESAPMPSRMIDAQPELT